MNKVITMTVMGLGLMAMPVRADYACKSFDGSTSFTLRRLPGKQLQAEVVITKDNQESVFGAKLISEQKGTIFQNAQFQLQTCEPTDSKLKIASSQFIGRGGCGRAGCEPKKIVTAILTHQETQTEFSCHEVVE